MEGLEILFQSQPEKNYQCEVNYTSEGAVRMNARKVIQTVALACFVVLCSLSSLITIPEEAWAYTPHAPINIDGNGDFTAANGVTSGDGTFSNPYIIEGWEVNASTETGIRIRNTDVHFTIRDVYVHSGGSSFNGVYVDNVTNSRIENTTIADNYYGIRLFNSHNATITGSNVTRNGNFGIYFDFSNNTTLVNNNVTWNDNYGIYLFISDNHIITGNTISNNRIGVTMWSSHNAKITGNIFIKNGLSVGGYTLSSYNSHTIAENNTVNGYPLYFHKNCSSLDIDGISVGQLIVVNSTDVRASNLHITDTDMAIEMAFVENATVTSNNLSNNVGGIGLLLATNFTISDNIFSSNVFYGVGLSNSTNGTVTNGNFSNSFTGIYLSSSSNISVHHNNFVNNMLHAYDEGGPENSWDDGYPSGGNYWDNYTGADQWSGPNQDQSGSDEIGDSPYLIDSDSLDRYPLMFPVGRISPQPPVLLHAILSGQNLENVTLSWDLSPDDGAGLSSVIGYRIYREGTFHPNGVGYQLHASLPNGTSAFVDVLGGEGNLANYFYRVCAFDTSGNTSCAMNQAGKFAGSLSPRPTLVSVPLVQLDNDTETVFQTLDWDKAWSYDPSVENWKWHMKFKPYTGEVEKIEVAQGLWIDMASESNFTIAGIVPSTITVHLRAGWNLIGFAYFKSAYFVGDLRIETGASWVEGYDPKNPPYYLMSLGDGDVLQPGWAYWVWLESDMLWTLDNY